MAKRSLTANDLRALAEAADGIRDKPAYVVWGDAGPELKTKRPAASTEVIFECVTDNIVPHRAKLRSITLEPSVMTTHGRPVTDIATRYDAMFWSEAAVEKFVLPYYIQSGHPELVDRLRKAFKHASVMAVAHLPESSPLLLISTESGNEVRALTLQEFEASL
jgi:hypothetical protein